ncbi:hypothetical protein V8C86DRAFT_2593469 [Haematococcus lacustris]
MVNTPLAATPSQRSMGISMLVEEGGPTPSGDLETWVNVSKVAPLAYIPTVGPSPHPHYHRRLQVGLDWLPYGRQILYVHGVEPPTSGNSFTFDLHYANCSAILETAGSRSGSGSGSGSGSVPGQRLGLGQVQDHEQDPGQRLKQGPRNGVVDDLNINEIAGSIPGKAAGGHPSPPAAVQQASAPQHLEAQLRTALGSCQAAAGQLQEAGEWQQQEASLLAAYQELAGELCDRVTSMAQELAQREAEILTLMDQVRPGWPCWWGVSRGEAG